jgi:hypothetical protein
MSTTKIEKENLEAHVEICAERYKNLETKIDNLEQRMDGFESHLIEIKNALASKDEKQTNRSFNILVSIFGIILTALLGIIAHGLFK